MRFLDLDLDFFLNDIAYLSRCETGRQSSEYKPWRISKVRRFLERRCGLSHCAPIPGRIVEGHDEVFAFWRKLIESGNLRIPFEVVHIDAHPDLSVGGGLYMMSGFLLIDSEQRLAMINRENIHSGNYLTFAIACGWIASLVWVRHREHKFLPRLRGDRISGLVQLSKAEDKEYSIRNLPAAEREHGVRFKILPWQSFRTRKTFDYIAMSRSPDFTPPESDELVPVIEEYIRPI